MSAKRRIIHGIGANGFGQAVAILIQLASVPILIHAWGIQLYGEWITLSAVPAYLALSDIGLSLVAGNSLALLAESGDIREMQTIYQSTWVMVTSLSVAVLIPVIIIVLFNDPGRFLGLEQITGGVLKATLLLLFSHVAMSMQTGILQLPFRVLKRNPFSVAAVNIIRLSEWACATLVVLAGGVVAEVALTFLSVRMLGNFCLWLILKRSDSALQFGIHYASLRCIRTLLRPSVASMFFPLGLSFTIQGFVLLVSSTIGSVGVAVFSIYRTFTRVPIQVATAINQAIWPELSYAFGANDMARAKVLVAKMLQFGAVLCLLSALAIFFLGEAAIDLWATKSLAHNPSLLHELTLAALVQILWQPFWVTLMATNRHTRFAAYFLVISALSLLLGWWFLATFGLTGAGHAILLAECLMFIAAFISYRRYLRVAVNA